MIASGNVGPLRRALGVLLPWFSGESDVEGGEKHEWNLVYATALLNVRWFRALAFWAIILLGVTNFGHVRYEQWLTDQKINYKREFWGFQIDSKGRQVGPATQLTAVANPNGATRQDILQTWITYAFSVSRDPDVEKNILLDFVGYHTKGNAAKFMQQFYGPDTGPNNPYALAKSRTREVVVFDVSPVGPDVTVQDPQIGNTVQATYLCRWGEIDKDLSQNEIEKRTRAASFHIVFGERTPKNVYGLYITDIIPQQVGTGAWH